MALKALEGGVDAGYWDFSGGRIDMNEYAVPIPEVIAREIKEELGDIEYVLHYRPVAIGRREVPPELNSLKRMVRQIFIFFEADFKGGTIQVNDEHIEYRWLDLHKINVKEYFTSGILEGDSHVYTNEIGYMSKEDIDQFQPDLGPPPIDPDEMNMSMAQIDYGPQISELNKLISEFGGFNIEIGKLSFRKEDGSPYNKINDDDKKVIRDKFEEFKKRCRALEEFFVFQQTELLFNEEQSALKASESALKAPFVTKLKLLKAKFEEVKEKIESLSTSV